MPIECEGGPDQHATFATSFCGSRVADSGQETSWWSEGRRAASPLTTWGKPTGRIGRARHLWKAGRNSKKA